jgi:hypothetical protein
MTHLNYLNRGKFLARAEQGGLEAGSPLTLHSPSPPVTLPMALARA